MWHLIDIQELLNYQREEGGIINAGAGGMTTSANVGSYAKPFGPMLRYAPYPFDQKTSLKLVPDYKRKKRRRK